MFEATRPITESLPDGQVVHHAAGSELVAWDRWTECARRAALSLELVRERPGDEDSPPVMVDAAPGDLDAPAQDEATSVPGMEGAAHVCPQCGDGFSTRRALGQHVRWQHQPSQ